MRGEEVVVDTVTRRLPWLRVGRERIYRELR